MRRSTRPKLKAPMPIGSILSQNLFGARTGNLLDLYKVQKAWAELVGPLLSGRTFPVRIRQKTLVVASENAAFSQHLSYMEDEITSALRAKGVGGIENLRFVTEALPSQRDQIRR